MVPSITQPNPPRYKNDSFSSKGFSNMDVSGVSESGMLYFANCVNIMICTHSCIFLYRSIAARDGCRGPYGSC